MPNPLNTARYKNRKITQFAIAIRLKSLITQWLFAKDDSCQIGFELVTGDSNFVAALYLYSVYVLVFKTKRNCFENLHIWMSNESNLFSYTMIWKWMTVYKIQ